MANFSTHFCYWLLSPEHQPLFSIDRLLPVSIHFIFVNIEHSHSHIFGEQRSSHVHVHFLTIKTNVHMFMFTKKWSESTALITWVNAKNSGHGEPFSEAVNLGYANNVLGSSLLFHTVCFVELYGTTPLLVVRAVVSGDWWCISRSSVVWMYNACLTDLSILSPLTRGGDNKKKNTDLKKNLNTYVGLIENNHTLNVTTQHT